MSGRSLWRCFDLNEVGRFSPELYNAMPQSFQNFFNSFFYNGSRNLVVSSPFGYRTLKGRLDFHYGTDVVASQSNLYPYFGVVTGLLLVSVGFHMSKIGTQTYLRPNYQAASGYGWFATFQPAEAVSNNEAKKWFLFFGHLDAPPFRLKNNLTGGYSVSTVPNSPSNSRPVRLLYPSRNSDRTQRANPDSEYIKVIREVILNTADGYTNDKNSRAELLVYENNKIVQYSSIKREELNSMNKDSALIKQFDGIENGKFPVGFTYSMRQEMNSASISSVTNQLIALLMGSTGESDGVHYHINLVYNCYYLDILEVIQNASDRPPVSASATRGCPA